MSIFINEFHYDNAGGDVGELVEIAGTDLSGYKLLLYNGSNGQSYNTLSLSGVIADQQNGFGAVSFAYPDTAQGTIQNGSPDGIALVDGNNNVVEFLSYEGSFKATNGAANGLTSTDVGVAETGTANGTSVARTGTGSEAGDFSWAVSTSSHGSINAGQSFAGGATPIKIKVDDAAPVAEGDTGDSTITFTVTRSGGAGAFSVDYATADGSAHAGSDYVATAGTLIFAAGQTEAHVLVAITGDTVVEPDESFVISLGNATGGATIAQARAQGVIVNDDQAATNVAISDTAVTEGDDGQTFATFTVTRTGDAVPFSVDFATADGTAHAGSDYVARNGTLSFAADETVKTITVAVQGDHAGEGAESFSVNLANATGNVGITDTTGVGTILDSDFTRISQIQGDANFSPILVDAGIHSFNVQSADTVAVNAVVTAIDDEGRLQGYYLMEQQGDWDDSALTSEGIFVMTRNDANVGQTVAAAAPGLQVGQTLTVQAHVMEYQSFYNLPRTMLTDATIVSQSAEISELPTNVLDGSVGRHIPNAILTDEVPDYLDAHDDPNDTFDPQNDALDFFETVEGMRVTIPNMVVADGFAGGSDNAVYFKAYSLDHANPEQINSRGGYTIAGDPPFSPPDTANPDDATHEGGKYLHDGDVNPDIVELDFSNAGRGGTSGFDQQLTMGDKLGGVSGVVDFDFGNLKVYVTDPVTLTDTQPVQETLTLADDARSLRVATFNVENLDPTDGSARFTQIAETIASNLKAPDIISVEEIQDNNGSGAGGTDASQTWQQLVDALNAATGKHYQYVDQDPVNGAEGGEPNGNIRVGFLYDTDRVQLGDLAADASLTERREYTDRIGDGVRDADDNIAFDDSMIASEINPVDYEATRKSLLGEFAFNGNTVYVTANHFPSKSGGSDNFYQMTQDLPSGQPENSDWAQRVAAADALNAILNRIAQGDGDARIISGGDYNDFYFYRPLEVAAGYVKPDGTPATDRTSFDNLTITKLPEAERYTYDFDGRSQAIDHILVDHTLNSVASYDIVHINTGYNQRNGAVNPAISDHDPAVAQFDFRTLAESLTGNAAANLIEGFGGDDTLSGEGGADTLAGGAGNDWLDGGPDNDIVAFTGPRTDYSFARGEAGSIIVADGLADRDGTDTVANAETFRFGDGATVSLDQLLVGVIRTGGTAADQLIGQGVGDRLYGYAGADTLIGLAGHDSLWGGQGNDVLAGGNGDDRLHGGQGNDSVTGDAGADVIVGGVGSDMLAGGAGDDIFFFARGDGRDIIADYTVGHDVLYLATGLAVTSSSVGDTNGDGVADLTVSLTGKGAVTVLGVGGLNQLAIVANQISPMPDIG
ncbi:Calx-beta domain-containing protein [Sphingomonas quercus]|uniref:Calx-beta domain-containing protein n=1 Tax=Sphingomonas quercus TaxID=2842451 RepID=A0ABS6BKQ9_9SPHN|nr:Calx-beta domain-containing protein [Sphingomonas quercus]MBU3078754.1 hypothetical protein [Sphingomonas quercus]